MQVFIGGVQRPGVGPGLVGRPIAVHQPPQWGAIRRSCEEGRMQKNGAALDLQQLKISAIQAQWGPIALPEDGGTQQEFQDPTPRKAFHRVPRHAGDNGVHLREVGRRLVGPQPAAAQKANQPAGTPSRKQSQW